MPASSHDGLEEASTWQRQVSEGSVQTLPGPRRSLILDVAAVASAPPRPDHYVRLRKCFFDWCRRLAASYGVAVLTGLLTVYALFGDDLRMMSTQRVADPVFDGLTVVCMVVFAFEITVSTFGKPGYFLNLFFWLDLLSTVTLVLDITTVNEKLFSAGGSESTGNSGQASRAARMSRVGTKAGRIMRIIRIVRLIRVVKLFKPADYVSSAAQGPTVIPGIGIHGDDVELEKESAVSKKLSERTTARVVTLVLIIMLMLPLFQQDSYREGLPDSAEYGVTTVRRALSSGLQRFRPWDNSTALAAYLTSKERSIYESDFLEYVYYHNWFCDADTIANAGKTKTTSPLGVAGRLFWVGVGVDNAADSLASFVFQHFLPGSAATYDWNSKWNGADWTYYQCDEPAAVISLLRTPMVVADLSGQETLNPQVVICEGVTGISLISGKQSYVHCPQDLRWQEVSTFTSDIKIDGAVVRIHAAFDVREGTANAAQLNMGQTIFICFLLGIASWRFAADANNLVLRPIERMIFKVNTIAANPLEVMNIQALRAGGKEVRDSKRSARSSLVSSDDEEEQNANLKNLSSVTFHWTKLRALVTYVMRRWREYNGETGEPMETVVLEKTIIKIGSLLALGFGEAGAGIIGQNMQTGNSSALSALIPGTRVEAVFGFCDIRNFTDATEVLQDKVMVFANQIAGVVHSCVYEFFGSPNKNIGDAFLLVWRLSGQPALKKTKLADMSLLCFVKILARVNKSKTLSAYRNHPKLAKRLPNYRVRMGFGLHSGWAIEGVIGSEFKIDASYLGPNVNMSSRLESSTKQYCCVILLSKSVIELMSREVAKECRLIDNVLMTGTAAPFKMYTIDLDELALEVDKERHEELDVEQVRKERWHDDFEMHSLFLHDPDVITMRARFTVEFACRFSMAYLNYEAGEWDCAKDLLEYTRFLLGTEDGPSTALLRFLRQHDWRAPKNWPGYRVLGG